MTKYYSWDIRSERVAIKEMDKSAFLHHGTGIPIQVRKFFDANNIPEGEKREIVLIYNGVEFPAHIEMSKLRSHMGRSVARETRLFWRKDFENIIKNKYPILFDLYSDDVKVKSSLRPYFRCEKTENENEYVISFLDPDEEIEDRNISWKQAVLNIVKEIPGNEFTLSDVYHHISEIDRFFPKNRNIKAKIRQQLQFLRADGYIEFLNNKGDYRKIVDSDVEYKYLNEIIVQTNLKNYRVEDNWANQKIRVGQGYFRKQVLYHFDYECCICQFDIERLLEAHHIHPWNQDPDNRLNPSNGLSLCKIHHGAIDHRFLKINHNHEIKVTDRVFKSKNQSVKDILIKYHNQKIKEPHELNLLL